MKRTTSQRLIVILASATALAVLAPQVGAFVGASNPDQTITSGGPAALEGDSTGSTPLESADSSAASDAALPQVADGIQANEPPVDQVEGSPADPASDPASDPTQKPVADPTSDPAETPADSPGADLAQDTTGAIAADAAADPAKEPAADAQANAFEEPTKDPVADPAEVPTDGQAGSDVQPTDQANPAEGDQAPADQQLDDPSKTDDVAATRSPDAPCMRPGTLNAPAAVGGNGRVHISSQTSGTLPGSAGTVDVVVNVDTTGVANKGIFDMDAVFVHSSANTSGGLDEYPVALYCYAEDAAVQNPTRGYARFAANWGGGDGAWTGIAIQLRPKAPTDLSSYAGDRITIVAGDSVYSPGDVIRGAAGLRIDEHAITTLLDTLKGNLHQLLLNKLVEQTPGHEVLFLKEGLDYTVAFETTPRGVDIKVHALVGFLFTLSTGRPRSDVCPNAHIVGGLGLGVDLFRPNLPIDLTVSLARDASSLLAITATATPIDHPVTLEFNSGSGFFSGFCDFFAFLSELSGMSELDRGRASLQALVNGIPDLLTTYIEEKTEAVTDSLRDSLPSGVLSISRLESDGSGAIAIVDAAIPSGLNIVRPSSTSAGIEDLVHRRMVGATPIDGAVYLSGEGLALAGVALAQSSAAPALFAHQRLGPYVEYDQSGSIRVTWPEFRFDLGGGYPNEGVTDLTGFGGMAVGVDPATGVYGVQFNTPPGGCNFNSTGNLIGCSALSLWETPLGFDPTATGVDAWNMFRDYAVGVTQLPAPFGFPLSPLRLRVLSGQISPVPGYVPIYLVFSTVPFGSFDIRMSSVQNPSSATLTFQPSSSAQLPLYSVEWSGVCRLMYPNDPSAGGREVALVFNGNTPTVTVALPRNPGSGGTRHPGDDQASPYWDCTVTVVATDAEGFVFGAETGFQTN